MILKSGHLTKFRPKDREALFRNFLLTVVGSQNKAIDTSETKYIQKVPRHCTHPAEVDHVMSCDICDDVMCYHNDIRPIVTIDHVTTVIPLLIM